MTGQELKDSLNKQIAEQNVAIQEIEKIKSLTNEFPDLKSNTDRWRKIFYSTPSANSKVTDCDFYHSCGCCDDSPLYVSPYFIHSSGQRIYAEPYRVCIGTRDYWKGERADTNWKEQLQKANYPQSVIDRVESYLNAYAPEEENE